MSVSKDFFITLVNVMNVPNTQQLIQIIRDSILPASKEAGRRLVIHRTVGSGSGDRVLYFTNIAGSNAKPCGLDFLGDQGGTIDIGAHKDVRVCGPVLGSSSPIERVFEDDDPILTRSIANTAVHELGHMIADLDHVDDPKNYMCWKAVLIPVSMRNRKNVRQAIGGPKYFIQSQIERLVEAIRSGKYADTFSVHTVK